MITGSILLLLLAAANGDEVTWASCYRNIGHKARIISPGLDYKATDLTLEWCGFQKVQRGDFDGLPNLDAIRLDNNQIEDIDVAAFTSVPILTNLVLYNNKLHEISNFSEYSNPRLTNLRLTGNQITNINNPKTFSGVPKLVKLFLDFNLIEHLHPDLFKPLNHLRELYLNNNKISFIAQTTFQIKSLKMLPLDHNLIEYVPAGAFRGAKLDGLRLDYNKISFLPANMATELVSEGARLESFRFCYNSWDCACLIEQVVEVKKLGVEDYDIYWDRQLAGRKPACRFTGRTCDRRTPSELVPSGN